jgi:AcrR family transcriptional regulator
MARVIPPDRFDAVLRAATAVFLRQGYRRTQMADVAEELGVAKGTLYLYVESKEALLEQVLLHADRAELAPLPARLPIPAPRAGSTLRKVRERIRREMTLPVLTAAARGRRTRPVREEAAEVARELMRLLSAHRVGIKLLDRCAPDYPELAALYFSAGRGGIAALLQRWLRRRITRRALPPVVDVAVTARLVLETAAFWAVHRHWDPAPQALSDELAEEAVVEFVTRALTTGKAR